MRFAIGRTRLVLVALIVAALARRSAVAQHAPSSAAPPVRGLRLGYLHELGGAPPESTLGVAGSILVIHGSGARHLITWDTATDRERLDLSASPSTDRWLRLPTVWRVRDSMLVASRGGNVTGVDVRTGARVFDSRLATGGEIVVWSHDGVSSDGRTWFGAISRFVPPRDEDSPTPMNHELVGVRVTDGSLAWRRPSDASLTAATEGAIVATVDGHGRLSGYDIASGVERWHGVLSEGAGRPACTGGNGIESVHGFFAVTCPIHRVMLFDARSGAYSGAITGAANSMLRIGALTSDGFVVGEFTSGSGQGGEATWSLYRAHPLQRVWTTSPSATRGYSLVHSARIDDTVFVCDDRGLVEGFSLANGARVWRWGFARCEDLAATGAGREARLYVSHGDGVAVFAPTGSDVPFERVTFEGRVTIDGAPWTGARVRVGDAVATTDATGRYRSTFEARGSVTIEVLSAAPASAERRGESLLHAYADPVRLDGRRGVYTVDVAAVMGHIDFSP